MLDRTVAAVVLGTDVVAAIDSRSARGVRLRVEALCGLGAHVVLIARAGARSVDALLGARTPGPGLLLLVAHDGAETYDIRRTGLRLHRRPQPHGRPATGEADLTVEGPSDGMRAAMSRLAGEGVGPGLVLVVTHGPRSPREHGRPGALPTSSPAWDPPYPAGWDRLAVVSTSADPGDGPPWLRHVGGGEEALLELLDEQVHRRRAGRVPEVDHDPRWTIRETGRDPAHHRVTESLLLLGDGELATRGAVEEEPPGSVPLVLAAGVYDGDGAGTHLLPAPPWTSVDISPPPEEDVRVLDLRTGVLVREETSPAGVPVRTARFASADLPGVVALRAEGGPERLRPGSAFRPPADPRAARGEVDGLEWVRARGSQGGIGAVARQQRRGDGQVTVLERVAAYVADGGHQPSLARARSRLVRAEREGFDRLLLSQRRTWAQRWDDVGVHLPDDPEAELGLRLALFHLWGHASHARELAVGARGISGTAYSGHVFWDADAYVLPALLSIDPEAAAAMVRYRHHRLPAARALARLTGRAGARFPWESAATGEDVTPVTVRMLGESVPIRTGALEEHVTADVAWAAMRWARWTGTPPEAAPAVADLVTETARYWASRCELDDDGSMHVRGVIGPDEYHEDVDDNAYTNVMARWNLREAVRLRQALDRADRGRTADADGRGRADPATEEEARAWCRIADALVDGLDPATGVYEQFRGYADLEPLLVADVAPPPVAADVLLGRARVARSQVVKQPDVLMLHQLVPEETPRGSLEANLDRYGPRTAHGSSLSPAVTAALLARAGRAEEALAMLHTALALDLEDLTGTTASGLHLATLAGSWTAVLEGFLGVRVETETLVLAPRLPARWRDLEVRFRCLGRRVRVRVTGGEVDVHTSRPLAVRVDGGARRLVGRNARFHLAPPGSSSSGVPSASAPGTAPAGSPVHRSSHREG